MHRFRIIKNESISRVDQIATTIRREIERGILPKNYRLPSINEFNQQYNFARDTVEKAYKVLKKEGYISSVESRGYFVTGYTANKLRVLLVFNKLSSYKKIVYESFIKTLGKGARVDLQVHHYDPVLLKEIIEYNLGQYHYYVIMPHFFPDADLAACCRVLNMIPENELVILDKRMEGLKANCIEVYQDFKNDIFNALSSANELLYRYRQMIMLMEEGGNHTRDVTDGAARYCKKNNKKFSIKYNAKEGAIQPGTVYITTNEADLVVLVKKARQANLQLGKDIGIISFNETPLKELLDITVITTDFEAMGRTAAECILQKNIKHVLNPFYFVRRGSL